MINKCVIVGLITFKAGAEIVAQGGYFLYTTQAANILTGLFVSVWLGMVINP